MTNAYVSTAPSHGQNEPEEGDPHLSFIIPALNEAYTIASVIQSITHAATSLGWNIEVIVVDHGSSDGTERIAAEAGASVLPHSGGTIADLRNAGAAAATGQIFVFLDADVTLTERWSERIRDTVAAIVQSKRLITGSMCSPPGTLPVPLRYWFESLALDPRDTHLGTGHMIMARSTFVELGGFNGALQTGEDFDLCERARSVGIRIFNDTDLKTVHHGFPATLARFVAREVWHGQGDTVDLRTMLHSKVVIGATAFIVLHLLLVAAIIAGSKSGIMTSVLCLALLLLGSSVAKNRHMRPGVILMNAGMFYFYYVGRAHALLMRLARK